MTTGNKTTSSAITGKTVLVVGATSSLAQAICHKLARMGFGLALAGRDENEIKLLARDLTTRHVTSCMPLIIDLFDPDFAADAFISQAGDFDHVIMVVGDMGGSDPADLNNLAYTSHINYILPAQIVTAAALRLEEKRGSIVIISSVAGDRGRQSNYPYGSAKAALSTFASGLRNSFFKKGVHVMTVKPGFVDTPMTWGLNSRLIASREYVAEKIVGGMLKRKDVIYVPSFWWLIMTIIIHIPEKIFKRLSL